ncbi:ATP-grasp domain-containing protein [Streptomyces sp. DSM 41987]|uniref:ATP-grasp domain-containing protein n=1 Tax=Streptomyces TaxID=1883 RepID=UPI003614FA4B
MREKRKIVVVYDKGAASPGEIFKGISRLGRVVFAVRESEYVARIMPVLQRLAEVVVIDESDLAASANTLRSTGASAILTFSERMLGITAQLASELGLLFHSPEVVELLQNKSLQRERLAQSGTDVVPCRRISDLGDWYSAVDEIGFPMVLKPIKGEGSRNTFKIDDFDSGHQIVQKLLAERSVSVSKYFLVSEKFLQGVDTCKISDYVSVESVIVRGAVTHIAVTGKFPLLPPFRETGQFWPTDLDHAECLPVTELASRAIEALGLESGLTHTEIKLTESGPKIIEINGRIGGWINELSLRALGIDLIEVAARIAMGLEIDLHLPEMDKVYFQASNLAPLRKGVLEEVVGESVVRELPNISSYRLVLRPGAKLMGGVNTEEIDLLCGETKDHASMLEVLDTALNAIGFRFSFSGESVTLTGSELWS